MLLYLCKTETAALLDPVVAKIGIHITKAIGIVTLQEFVINKMRKYGACSHFCIDRTAVQENDNDFIEALKSFQMMYSAKIIVMHSTENGFDAFARTLRNMGAVDVITATDVGEQLSQFMACMLEEKTEINESVADSLSVVAHVPTPAMPVFQSLKTPISHRATTKEIAHTEYRFDCINVEIGIAGATRRVGVTTFAMCFAHWLKAHGGTVCYMVINENGHMDSIAETYGFMGDDDANYSYDGVDYIAVGTPEIDYNFIIYDFGNLTKEKMKRYKDCNMHFLCGASKYLHEIVEFSKALKPIKAIKPHIITHPLLKDLERTFSKEVCDNPIEINKSASMLDFTANIEVYKEFIKDYIIETQKRF